MSALRLWKYGRITGLWRAERTVTPDTSAQWLAIYRRDEPEEIFIVSARRPTHRKVPSNLSKLPV